MAAAEALFRQAADLHRQGRFAEAARLYDEVLEADPSAGAAQDNLALALLGAGDYGRGFSLYERRFDRPAGRVPKPRLSFPEWQGEPLAGRSILVWTEQGFGDQIMYARFVAALARMGAQVSLLTPPPLARLFSALPARIIEAAGQVQIPRHDFWIMPGSLPARLGVTLESLPREPYLPGRAGGAGVGVGWHGDWRHPVNHLRSLPPELRDRLLGLRGARSLHPEDTGAADFRATADLIKDLALVITVDTSLAHLAGAMGKPVWVLLSAEQCCWRWLSERSDSPWYPSMRLFRQDRPGDWRPVVDQVTEAAGALIPSQA